jgi:hypothetical protein
VELDAELDADHEKGDPFDHDDAIDLEEEDTSSTAD